MPSEARETDTDLQRGFEPLRTIFAVLVLLLGFAASARGAPTGFGAMEASAADGAVFELAALTSEVDVEVSGLVAEARVRQRFSNTSAQWIEVQYLLPLPNGAAVHAMTVRIGERLIVADIEEREQARTRYVEAAAGGRRAALVENDSGNLFRTAVANIAPGDSIEVDVHWWQTIDWRDDRFALTLPLTYTPRYRSADAEGAPTTSLQAHSVVAPRVTIRVDVDAGLAINRFDSPTHAIAIARHGRRHAVTLAGGDAPADRDFVLEWAPILGQAPAAALLTEQRNGETFALVMLLPRAVLDQPLPRELILVIDTSGSMQGESLQQARSALDLALAALGPEDRFNVIQFNSSTEALFDAPVEARAEDVRLAREWVAGLRADGGTEMVPALRRAFAGEPAPGYLRQVVFATDGAIDDARALYAEIDSGLGASRLFPIGIGSAPNASFIERAATLGRGRSIVIRSALEIEQRMRELFDALDRPALRDLSLQWPDVAETYPQRLPDIYAGEPLMVVARLPHAAGALVARGAMASAPWSTSLALDRGASAPGIARLWAQRKIDGLQQSLDRGGDPAAVREAVLTLALEHRLVTPYTSLVATEKTPARAADDDLVSQRIANGLPSGSLAFAATATTAARSALLGLVLLVLAAVLARPRVPAGARRRVCPHP